MRLVCKDHRVGLPVPSSSNAPERNLALFPKSAIGTNGPGIFPFARTCLDFFSLIALRRSYLARMLGLCEFFLKEKSSL
jgi:hypothetical protein